MKIPFEVGDTVYTLEQCIVQKKRPCSYCDGSGGFYDPEEEPGEGNWESCYHCDGDGDEIVKSFKIWKIKRVEIAFLTIYAKKDYTEYAFNTVSEWSRRYYLGKTVFKTKEEAKAVQKTLMKKM